MQSDEIIIEISDERVIAICNEMNAEYNKLIELKKVENKAQFEKIFRDLKVNSHYFYLYENLVLYLELYGELAERYNTH